MTTAVLRNFCVVPETRNCTCILLGCGGIDVMDIRCLEHNPQSLKHLAKTHLHPIQG